MGKKGGYEKIWLGQGRIGSGPKGFNQDDPNSKFQTKIVNTDSPSRFGIS